MKMAYVTSILSPSKDAQSVQVASMWKVFYEELQNDFLVLAPDVPGAEKLQFIKRIPFANQLHRSVRMVYVACYALVLLKKSGISHVYTRDIALASFFSLFGFVSVYEIHKPFETFFGKNFFRIFSKKLLLVSISEAIVEHLRETYGLTSSIYVAHDGAFPQEKMSKDILPEHNELLAQKDKWKTICLYTGGTTKGKGIDVVLEMAKLAPEILFVLVGPKKEELRFISKNILPIGRVDHRVVGTFYQFADALLLPNTKQLKYWKYTSPLKLFEYMSTGIPMIASNVGSIAEVIDERHAIIFDPDNKKTILSALDFLLSQKNEAKKRAEFAKNEFLKTYTWSIRAKNIITYISTYEKNSNKK